MNRFLVLILFSLMIPPAVYCQVDVTNLTPVELRNGENTFILQPHNATKEKTLSFTINKKGENRVDVSINYASLDAKNRLITTTPWYSRTDCGLFTVGTTGLRQQVIMIECCNATSETDEEGNPLAVYSDSVYKMTLPNNMFNGNLQIDQAPIDIKSNGTGTLRQYNYTVITEEDFIYNAIRNN